MTNFTLWDEAVRAAGPELYRRIQRERVRMQCLKLATPYGGITSEILDRADTFYRFVDAAPDDACEQRLEILQLALHCFDGIEADTIVERAALYEGFVTSVDAETASPRGIA